MSSELVATDRTGVGAANMQPAVEARWSWGLTLILRFASGLLGLRLALFVVVSLCIVYCLNEV